MKYIADTHGLVWYFADDERLSSKVKKILQQAEAGRDEIIIPVIVLLEAIGIQEKKKVVFDMQKLFNFIQAMDSFTVSDLTFSQAMKLLAIGKGLDLHDRTICTVARLTQSIVLTKDAEIKKHVKTVW